MLVNFVTLSLHLKKGEDVALPEVPTEPLPEVPEAAEAEPGTVDFCTVYIYIFVFDARLVIFALLSFLERREAKKHPGKEMLAA